jgi:hypothetical protein
MDQLFVTTSKRFTTTFNFVDAMGVGRSFGRPPGRPRSSHQADAATRSAPRSRGKKGGELEKNPGPEAAILGKEGRETGSDGGVPGAAFYEASSVPEPCK